MTAGDLTATGVTIARSTAQGNGGALYVTGGAATFVTATIVDSLTPAWGGVLFITDGTVAFFDSVIARSSAWIVRGTSFEAAT